MEEKSRAFLENDPPQRGIEKRIKDRLCLSFILPQKKKRDKISFFFIAKKRESLKKETQFPFFLTFPFFSYSLQNGREKQSFSRKEKQSFSRKEKQSFSLRDGREKQSFSHLSIFYPFLNPQRG
jgi:hypothetical protein